MYKLIYDPESKRVVTVLFVPTNTFIPLDPANTDYAAYLAWLAEGNEPLPAGEQGASE